jgi:hypothetical protein
MCVLYLVLYTSPYKNAKGLLIRALLTLEHGGIFILLNQLTRYQKEQTKPKAFKLCSKEKYNIFV